MNLYLHPLGWKLEFTLYLRSIFCVFIWFLAIFGLWSQNFSLCAFWFFLSLCSGRVQRHPRVDESESMFSMWMAAEIDPRGEHVSRSHDSRAKSCALTLVERERACVSSRVSPIARISREKRGFTTVRKRGLSDDDVALVRNDWIIWTDHNRKPSQLA